MIQAERRIYLIKELLAEQPRYRDLAVPRRAEEQKQLLRALMNVRGPREIGKDFLAVQDEYLQAELARKGVTDAADLTPVSEGICLWKGNITTLRCDAIVNAANSGMTGCYVPCHGCIDNCIHTYAGMQLEFLLMSDFHNWKMHPLRYLLHYQEFLLMSDFYTLKMHYCR